VTIAPVAGRFRPLKAAWSALIPAILAVALSIEGLLALRLWTQLTGQTVTGVKATVMAVTDVLVSPFAGYDSFQSAKETGIFQYSTLVAIEVYLVAAIGAVVAVLLLRLTWTLAASASRGLAIRRVPVTEGPEEASAGTLVPAPETRVAVPR